MKAYRKKPVVIHAARFDGTKASVPEEIREHASFVPLTRELLIPTLEGQMAAHTGDYIIKGIAGEFYPCKPEIFHKTYEPAHQPC